MTCHELGEVTSKKKREVFMNKVSQNSENVKNWKLVAALQEMLKA